MLIWELDSIIVNMPEIKAFADRIMTLFVVDKGLNKIVKFSMDYVIKRPKTVYL